MNLILGSKLNEALSNHFSKQCVIKKATSTVCPDFLENNELTATVVKM